MLANQERIKTAHQLLRIIYGVVPIVAGADKFTNLLTNWPQYVNPAMGQLLPLSTTTLMHVVGLIEVFAGVLVLSRFTTVGAYLVSVWLALIAVSLIASGHYLDIAVRDLAMSAGAFSLASLSQVQQVRGAPKYKETAARAVTA